MFVYKVLLVRPVNGTPGAEEYCSPYHKETTWTIGERKDINADLPDLSSDDGMYKENGLYHVEGDAFHSFDWHQNAIAEARFLEAMRDDENFVLAQFVIPKDSKFVFVGRYCGSRSYASSSLILKRTMRYI